MKELDSASEATILSFVPGEIKSRSFFKLNQYFPKRGEIMTFIKPFRQSLFYHRISITYSSLREDRGLDKALFKLCVVTAVKVIPIKISGGKMKTRRCNGA
jgi:hypothetical protein